MLFKQLKYFVAIVDSNSFTEAAEVLFISQSAISQQMKALEENLGVTLMKRENRKFTLTPAGDYLYRQSRQILTEIEDIKHETMRIGQDNELQLRIGYLSGYHGYAIRAAVAEFAGLYPGIYMEIREGNHEEIYEQMRDGKVDMVLNDQRRAFSDEYVNRLMTELDSFIEVSEKNHFSKNNAVTIEELQKLPCILIASKDQQMTEREFYQNTIGFGGNFLFAGSMEAARLMVLAGRGFLPIDGKTGELVDYPGIRRLPLYRNERQLKRNFCVFWKKENTNYYIEEFAGILTKYFKCIEEKGDQSHG